MTFLLLTLCVARTNARIISSRALRTFCHPRSSQHVTPWTSLRRRRFSVRFCRFLCSPEQVLPFALRYVFLIENFRRRLSHLTLFPSLFERAARLAQHRRRRMEKSERRNVDLWTHALSRPPPPKVLLRWPAFFFSRV